MAPAQPAYAHTHKKLLTRVQTEAFITALKRARLDGDAEHTIQHAVKTLLEQGLSAIYTTPVHASLTHNTDGYIAPVEKGLPYALLIECKRDLNFSASKRDIAQVLAQVCSYLRNIAATGDPVPTVTVVCDLDEIFAIPTTLLQPHINGNYAWETHAPSGMHNDAALMAALIDDANIRPYVHDITHGFDADMFIWAVDAMGLNEPPVKAAVNETSIEHVFLRFKMEVLGTDAAGLKNKDEIALFLDILRGDENVYPHPMKHNTLVWHSREITLDTYRFDHFWSQYVKGDYTLDELKSLTRMADTLIEESDRRFSGDYWTPPVWVDKSHEYIEDALGHNWKERYVVYDPAAGALNLTRDYRFNELYCSTLFQEELDMAVEYNPEAVKFQYDFLNDDMVLHEEGTTADKALELARAGELKMPLELVEALAANAPIVFYANPPYGQATSPDGKKHKPGVSATAVTDLMGDMGHAKGELYTQFIWRTKELAKIFDYTADFHIFFFNKMFLTSPNFGKFVDEFTSEFTFNNGFMMNAGEFNGTSSAWGVAFSHFVIGGTNQQTFDYSVLKSNKNMSIDTLTDWTGHSVQRGETISDWLADIALPKDKDPNPILTKNGLDAPTSKNPPCVPCKGAIGYLHNNGNNVQFSDKYTGIYTMGFASAHGRDITPDNLERAAVTFSIRRSVQEVIAAQKLLWVRDKDIFTRPPASLLTPEFIADCMVYAIFDRQSNQTSLRDYEYKGQTHRVINEFFPYSKDSIVTLAQQHRNRILEADAVGDHERIVYQWLQQHSDNISEEAQALLDLAWMIIEYSFDSRKTYATIEPRFQTNSWDAGWAQINAMVFGTKRINDNVYNSFYERFRATRKNLGDNIAHAAMDAGVI